MPTKDLKLEIRLADDPNVFIICDQKSGAALGMFSFTGTIDLDYNESMMLVSLVRDTLQYDGTAQLILGEHIKKLGADA